MLRRNRDEGVLLRSKRMVESRRLRLRVNAVNYVGSFTAKDKSVYYYVELDANGKPVMPVDQENKKILPIDSSGNEMVERDKEGNPVVHYGEDNKPCVRYVPDPKSKTQRQASSQTKDTSAPNPSTTAPPQANDSSVMGNGLTAQQTNTITKYLQGLPLTPAEVALLRALPVGYINW